MTSRDFCYWLQGYIEISRGAEKAPPLALDAHQVDVIRRHLEMVFIHEIDPSAGPPAHQAELDAVHKPPLDVPHDPANPERPKIGGVGPGGTLYRC